MPYMSVPGLLDARGEFNRVIRDVASRTNSVLVEMEDVLPATRKYYADSNHFTALGNQIVGEHVARILNESQQFQQLLQEKQRSLASAG